jgi:hypothetical protein
VRAVIGRMFGHTCTIRAYIGEGAKGAQYGTAVTEKCRLNEARRFAPAAGASEVLAETVIYMRAAAVCPARSKVTVNGREWTVVRSVPRNGGTLPTPAHLEVVLK